MQALLVLRRSGAVARAAAPSIYMDVDCAAQSLGSSTCEQLQKSIDARICRPIMRATPGDELKLLEYQGLKLKASKLGVAGLRFCRRLPRCSGDAVEGLTASLLAV